MTRQTWNMLSFSGIQHRYSKPETLNINAHAKLRYKPDIRSYSDAEHINLVPLLGSEFAQAMMHYPIIFAGTEKMPFAVMGLLKDHNFFVKDGQFEEGAYIPAYLRRHPFTLDSSNSDQLVVCIDRAAAGFVTGSDGEALFENGKPSEFIKYAMDFLVELEIEMDRTRTLIDAINDAGILEAAKMAFAAPGYQELTIDYYAVAEARLRALGDKQLASLMRSGAMASIDAHLLSLQRWNLLLARNAASSHSNLHDA